MVALTVVGCCLGAVAFAATRRDSIEAPASGKSSQRPLRPRLTEYPDQVTTSHSAQFTFAQPARPTARRQPGRAPSYECRLDRNEWEPCESPLELEGVALGSHRFEVRARNASETVGPATSREWRVVRQRTASDSPTPTPVAESAPVNPPPEVVPAPPEEPEGSGEGEEPEGGEEEPTPEDRPFSIEPEFASLGPLYPGAPAEPLPVTLVNPNPEPIVVTDLRVTVDSAPEGCDPGENFEAIAAGVSTTTPVAIPAEGSVTLPAQGVEPPALAMRELPVSQDACQGAQLPLTFSGEAHG